MNKIERPSLLDCKRFEREINVSKVNYYTCKVGCEYEACCTCFDHLAEEDVEKTWDSGETFEMEQFLDRWTGDSVSWYLVKWKGYGLEQTTWKSKTRLIKEKVTAGIEMAEEFDRNYLSDEDTKLKVKNSK